MAGSTTPWPEWSETDQCDPVRLIGRLVDDRSAHLDVIANHSLAE